MKPGTTLYWNLNRQTSDATLKDFKVLDTKPQGLTTTVQKDGTFEISLQSLQDKTKENNEQFQIDLFKTPTLKQSIASSGSVTLIDAKIEEKTDEKPINKATNKSKVEPDLSIPSQVIPASFSDKRIPVTKLVDFSNQDQKSTFNLGNSKGGGYFECQK